VGSIAVVTLLLVGVGAAYLSASGQLADRDGHRLDG
jgi:hypothetical protein